MVSLAWRRRWHGLASYSVTMFVFFFFQAEDGIRDYKVTGVQTCALPISASPWPILPSFILMATCRALRPKLSLFHTSLTRLPRIQRARSMRPLIRLVFRDRKSVV